MKGDFYKNPELLLSELLRREATGGSETRVLYRASVLAVDHEGGRLQNESGNGQVSAKDANGRVRTYPAIVGVRNPRGAVKARILSNGMDNVRTDEDLRVFWPMLPPDQIGIPVSPGEHVYVMFEGNGFEHGLWVARVSGHESANSFQGKDSYTAPGAPVTAMDSFEQNGPDYPRDDASAGEAPTDGAMGAFKD